MLNVNALCQEAAELCSMIGEGEALSGTTAASYGVAMINGCPDEETAKAFIDFIISDEGQGIYAESSLRPANFSFTNTSEFLPDVNTIKLVAEDYEYIASHRQEFLDRFNDIWAKYN